MNQLPPKDEQPEILDDEVESSRAPLLTHLIELRGRLIKILLALGTATIFAFFFADQIYNLLVAPFASMAEDVRGSKLEFIFTAPMEFFFAKLKLALFAGVFLAFPVIAWQVYAFVAPGLYKNERGAFWPYLVFAPLLFSLGAAFVYFIMLPMLARFTISMEQVDAAQTTIKMMPRVSDYLALVMSLMLAFGISFQLPVILTLLAKIGIVTSEGLGKGRKYAIVGILAFAAVFTPPDAISQLLLAVPVYCLYEISIFCVRLIEKKAEKEEAATAAE
ncbi:Sec-independent protein translocase TatC [Hyphomonas neptunium ATCC 15444]|uniref:Sec-independent protein translocase protein TatC n=2 Tax=Hyphomonas TaxID=85 RepID=Q0C0W0_HYPNA|nr:MULTISPECIES: twin-arginine translocase subunit TatC [Hyphomonas]ABI77215.1 Sec-independent protein translocase TatC [Hyphomonas neptunium ATCC 15444]KCZ94952.1 Sec-independent protein translocase TatC [Hyphomonas hirschiana VP5]